VLNSEGIGFLLDRVPVIESCQAIELQTVLIISEPTYTKDIPMPFPSLEIQLGDTLIG